MLEYDRAYQSSLPRPRQHHRIIDITLNVATLEAVGIWCWLYSSNLGYKELVKSSFTIGQIYEFQRNNYILIIRKINKKKIKWLTKVLRVYRMRKSCWIWQSSTLQAKANFEKTKLLMYLTL
jgi:hypothetical protein